MIYILSNSFDSSTQKIAFWLHFYKKPFRILNTEVEINKIKININNEDTKFQFSTKHEEYSINPKKDRFFYRRGILKIETDDLLNLRYFSSFFNNESKTLREFAENILFHFSTRIRTLKELNKLEVLVMAARLKLKIPQTIITSSKQDVVEFPKHLNHRPIITKPIYEGINIKLDKGYLKTYTSIVNQEDIKNMSDSFFPTLFQEKINKWIEVRSFYLLGKFYSMAIFSQDDQQTSVDFRNYNFSDPNVVTPFLLPKKVSSKIEKLFSLLKIDSGSVDLCLTPENEFIFLEINPVGEYDMVSVLCNYHLHRELAKNI